MAGEMKAKLVLDGKDFDLVLKKSKKSAEEFGKTGKKAGNEFVNAFKGITAAVAAFKSVEGAFKSFVNSSQTIGDQFRANIDGMKSVVDNFVYSLANSDFSPFADGLANMFNKAKEAAAAADQFGNTQMATNFVMSTQGAAYREAMAKARDKSLSNEERQYWVEQARLEAAAIQEAQKTLERDALEKLKTELAAQTGLNKYFVGEKAIIDAITLDATYGNQREREAIDEAYNKLIRENDARIAEVEKAYTSTAQASSFGGSTTIKAAGYDEAMAKAQEANRQRLRANADLVVKYNLLFRKSDEALKEVYATAVSAVAARNQLSEITTSTNEVGTALTTDMEKSAAAAAKLAAEERAVREEYARLAELVKNNPIDTSVMSMSALPTTFSAVKTGAEMKAELPSAKSFLTGKSRIEEIDAGALSQEIFDNKLIKDAERQVAALEEVDSVVGMLRGSFASLGGSIEGTAGNMLTFVGSVLDAVQAIIPLIGYIQAEITMHNANASAAAKEAAAKTLSAYAGMPFAGVALGLAGVASIVAAIQSIPKFAEGGIVNRATLGVFGEAGPEAVMPLDKLEDYIAPRELRVTGAIKASGKDLVVVLDNYNRVRNG